MILPRAPFLASLTVAIKGVSLSRERFPEVAADCFEYAPDHASKASARRYFRNVRVDAPARARKDCNPFAR